MKTGLSEVIPGCKLSGICWSHRQGMGLKFYWYGKFFWRFYKGFIEPSYPSHLTYQEKCHSNQMTQEARDTCFRVKDLLISASQLVIKNETDPLILYTDAYAVSIGGVFMQEQNGIENSIIFILHF